MNPAVIRLALMGSRPAWGRLSGIIIGVAAGICLFLLLIGASGALNARDLRSNWMTPESAASAASDTGTIQVLASIDRFDGSTINRLDVAAAANSAVKIPGVPAAPRVGEFYGSPALIRMVHATPADQLGDRYGRLVGVLPDSVLASPDSLVVIAGKSEASLAVQGNTLTVSTFGGGGGGSSGGGGIGGGGSFGGKSSYQTAMLIGAIAVLFPVLLLVSIVTGLGAAERRERFAALRLIGATPRSVTIIAASEIVATTLTGSILGVLLAALLRPLAAAFPIDGGSLFVADLAVAPAIILLTIVGIVACSTVVAVRRVTRAGIGPLGAARQARETAPKMILMLPLALGVITLVCASVIGRLVSLPLRVMDVLVIGCFIVVAVGLLLAGPYLTFIASRLLARRAHGAADVIAANRIIGAPRATFRSVSGLVIAVFMVSVFAGAATSALQTGVLSDSPGLLPLGTLVAYSPVDPSPGFDTGDISALAGVTAVSTVYSAAESSVVTQRDAALLGFRNIPATPLLRFTGNLLANDLSERSLSPSTLVGVEGLTRSAIAVRTDGSVGAIERARTWLENAHASIVGRSMPGTRSDEADTTQLTLINSFATLAYIGIAIATLIAGATLAVSTISAVFDRRRTLGLLRLIGMRTSTVRRIVVFEAGVPLIAVVALSAALGLVVAWLMLTGLTSGRRTLGWPQPGYYIALGSSLILALGAVATSFGTIRRHTAISTTRFE